MRNIKLTLQYDGTNYHGWQVQPGLPTVQGTIEDKLHEIFKERVRITGAGRTDVGVHALGQVANFKIENRISAQAILRALNSLLPRDIAVVDACEIDLSFHARYSAKRKLYKYLIVRTPHPSPFKRNYAYHCSRPLDLNAMRLACGYLIGEHDFSSFRAADLMQGDPMRTIYSLEITDKADLLEFYIEASGFLKHMARNIVGTLLEVGLGRREPLGVRDALELKDRRAAGPSAPQHGLYLVSVTY